MNLFENSFSVQVDRCGLNVEDKSAVEKYGVCINDRYCWPHTMTIISSFSPRFPETRKLNLGQTLSSGHGSVSFDSDQDCTNFVHSFFPDCKPYLSSCSQVGQKLLRILIFLLFRLRRTKTQRCSSWAAFLATTPP